MILLAMALAASDYPAFDPEQTALVCEEKRKEATWGSIYDTNEECVADQRGDHRHFLVLAESEPALRPSFTLCLERWTKNGLPDWGMIAFCANDMVNGKRDFVLLRRAAPKAVRASIDNCAKGDGDDDGPADWDERWSCAREQMSGYRDFQLFRAAAPDGETRKAIDGCASQWIDGEAGTIDWSMVVECAEDAGQPTVREGDDEEAIVVT
jgi:hypothetical protein